MAGASVLSISLGKQCQMRCYREGVVYAGRCRRCYLQQLEEGKKEEEVVHEIYLGESSRSVVSRAREHYNSYKLSIGKTAKTKSSSSTAREDRESEGEGEREAPGEEEGSSWMADHALSHHRGKISADVTEDFEFFVVGSSNKPLYRQL